MNEERTSQPRRHCNLPLYNIQVPFWGWSSSQEPKTTISVSKKKKKRQQQRQLQHTTTTSTRMAAMMPVGRGYIFDTAYRCTGRFVCKASQQDLFRNKAVDAQETHEADGNRLNPRTRSTLSKGTTIQGGRPSRPIPAPESSSR